LMAPFILQERKQISVSHGLEDILRQQHFLSVVDQIRSKKIKEKVIVSRDGVYMDMGWMRKAEAPSW
jgi:hypothetical protein